MNDANSALFTFADGSYVDANHGAIQVVEGNSEVLLLPRSKEDAERMAAAFRHCARYLLEQTYV